MSQSDYVEMIEVPISSCEVEFLERKTKKKNKKNVVSKLNKKFFLKSKPKKEETSKDEVIENNESGLEKELECIEKSNVPMLREEKKKFKFDIVGCQIVAIFVLVLAILLTNVFWEDSGINTLLRQVFNIQETVELDERSAQDLSIFAPIKDSDVEVIDGVMTIDSECAIYPTAEGEVLAIEEGDGGYTITVKHSDVCKSVISGVDYVYCEIGDTCYTQIPIGYSLGEGLTCAIYNDNQIVTDFTFNGGQIVWEK